MIPEEVCHYTKKETVFKILSTKKLRIGQFKFTNDPRESKERNYPLIYEGNSQVFNATKHSKITSKIVKLSNNIAAEEWKVLCVTLHLPQKKLLNLSDSSLEDGFTQIYNERLRQGYSHPRMWAHYANNHSGACFILDGHKLNDTIHKTFRDGYTILQGPVIYDINQLLPWGQFIDTSDEDELAEYLRDFYKINYAATFLSKHTDWEHEVEFRWLLHNIKRKNEYVSIENTVKHILLGNDFPPSDKLKLIPLCKKLKVAVGEMQWEQGLPIPKLGNLYNP